MRLFSKIHQAGQPRKASQPKIYEVTAGWFNRILAKVEGNQYQVQLQTSKRMVWAPAKALTINIHPRRNAAQKQIQQYIQSRLRPTSFFTSATTRFAKLELAKALLDLYSEPRQANFENRFLQLYERAARLESLHYDLIFKSKSYTLPAGKLGQLLIKLRKDVDPAFKNAYESPYRLGEPIYGPAF